MNLFKESFDIVECAWIDEHDSIIGDKISKKTLLLDQTQLY